MSTIKYPPKKVEVTVTIHRDDTTISKSYLMDPATFKIEEHRELVPPQNGLSWVQADPSHLLISGVFEEGHTWTDHLDEEANA